MIYLGSICTVRTFQDERNGILAVQSMRNILMGLTLMATTSILLSSALAAVLSSSYSIKKPMKEAVMYGGRGDVMMGVKYVTVLVFFLLAFLFYCLSAKSINQVCFLINVRCDAGGATSSYVCDLMEKMSLLHLIGDRLVYTALPLLTWIFGPVMVFACSVFVVLPLLYSVDVVYVPAKMSTVFGEDI